MRQMIVEKKANEVKMLKTTKGGGDWKLQGEIGELRVSH